MIFRAVKKLLQNRHRRARVITADVHGIAPQTIDSDADTAVKKLQQAGFETYIVGGAVRDLLLGVAPKDFDLSTAATPAEVRAIFRRARIIGRRFKIVHLTSYRGGQRRITEVTTFRADGEDVIADAAGRILQDNTFGDASQDAVRRDFTCNALFYDPAKQQILDYVGGYEDILRRQLRVIGNPTKRFRQDPVRMLRALRLHAKLGLQINQPLHAAMCKNAPLLADIAHSRLFDEVIKIANSGAAADIFLHYADVGVARHVLPIVCNNDFAAKVLQDSDRRCRADKDISLSFMFSGLFWTPVAQKWRELRQHGVSPVRAMENALDAATFSDNPIVPRRIISRVIDLYFLQARMESRMTVQRANGLIRHPLFTRAVSFAALREDGATIAQWWSDYQRADFDEREKIIASTRKVSSSSRSSARS